MQSTRAFIAIEIQEPALSTLGRLLERLGKQLPQVRWSTVEQLHVTVKFMGQIDNRLLPEICQCLRLAASHLEAFEISLANLGTFPTGKAPRIVWAGIGSGTEALCQLHTELDASLAELGIAREGRKFTPHLTLGRVARGQDPGEITRIVDKASDSLKTQCSVDEILMMASNRVQGRMVYETIDRVAL